MNQRLTTGGLGAFVFDGLQEHESTIRDDHGETQASIELVFLFPKTGIAKLDDLIILR